MQVTKKVYLCAIPGDRYNYEQGRMEQYVDYTVWCYKEYDGHPAVAELDVTFEIPDNINPTDLKLVALNRERTKLQADFQNRITEIQAEINSLLAIESNVVVPQGNDLDIPF
jgi:hypothetical protein